MGWADQQDANFAAAILQAEGIAAYASWTIPEIAADPHLRERRAIIDVNRCGEVGRGQVVKLINNSLLFVHVAALAEMLDAGECAGGANKTLLEVLSISSADSFALRNHGMKARLPRAFPENCFPMDYPVKDLDYALDLAEQGQVDPKLARLATGYYQQAIDAGIGAKYFQAIVEPIEAAGQ